MGVAFVVKHASFLMKFRLLDSGGNVRGQDDVSKIYSSCCQRGCRFSSLPVRSAVSRQHRLFKEFSVLIG